MTHFGCSYAGANEPALSDISLELCAGDLTAVVGTRSAGKSTLALAASGLLEMFYQCAIAGQIATLGMRDMEGEVGTGLRPVLTLDPLRNEVSFLPERPAAGLSGLADSVFDEVALSLRNRGLIETEVRLAVESALTSVGIAGLANRHPFQLSGGEQKLVALASALAQSSKLIVLDCPLSGLDRDHRRQVIVALEQILRAGSAALLTERRLTYLADLDCRVWLLERGRLVSSLRVREGIPPSQLDSWQRAGLPAASVFLADQAGADNIPLYFPAKG